MQIYEFRFYLLKIKTLFFVSLFIYIFYPFILYVYFFIKKEKISLLFRCLKIFDKSHFLNVLRNVNIYQSVELNILMVLFYDKLDLNSIIFH